MPYYNIKSWFDLSKYVCLSKLSLAHERQIAHDFTTKVTDGSNEQRVEFTYRSKWFLKEIASGDME